MCNVEENFRYCKDKPFLKQLSFPNLPANMSTLLAGFRILLYKHFNANIHSYKETPVLTAYVYPFLGSDV